MHSESPQSPDKHATYARKRLAFLIVGLITLFCIGVINAWSILVEPLSNQTGWSTQSMSNTYRILIITYCLGCLASSIIQGRCNGNPRPPLFIGAVLILIGLAAPAALANRGSDAVMLSYGVIAGLGMGFGFNAILTTVNLWFPDRLGFVSGIQMFAFCAGPLVLGTPIDSLMKTIGWQTSFVGMGLVFAGSCAAAAIVAWKPPTDIHEVFAVESTSEGIAGRRGNPLDFAVSARSFTAAEALRSKVFWIGLAWFIAIATVCVTLIGESKQDAMTLGMSSGLATLLAGLVAVGEGVSGIVYGMVVDRFGIANLIKATTWISIVATGVIALSFFTGSWIMFFAGALLLTLGYGGLPVFSATFSLNRFGRKHYSTIYAISTSWLIAGSMLGMFVTPIFSSISPAYDGLLSMYAGLFALIAASAVIMVVFIKVYRSDMRKLIE